MGLSSATHRKPTISVQKRCDTSRFRTFSTRWLMARGGWAADGGTDPFPTLFDMVTSPLTDSIVYRDGDGPRCLPASRRIARVSAGFLSLTPDRILDAVEVGGLRSTGRCLPLRAFENRVYEVELEDESRLVVKFYRPGRWSRETIVDEHKFLLDLAEAEVPAVAPTDLGTGQTLNEIEGIYYAAFPRIRGRSLDELDAEHRRHIGRTLGRLHAVGAARPAPHRPTLGVEHYVHEPLRQIEKIGFMPENLWPRYRDIALRIAEVAAPQLAAVKFQRVHGDLHWGNILWTRDGPILVDFDDCVMGPPVQDLWLLARGRDEEARKAREDL